MALIIINIVLPSTQKFEYGRKLSMDKISKFDIHWWTARKNGISHCNWERKKHRLMSAFDNAFSENGIAVNCNEFSLIHCIRQFQELLRASIVGVHWW